MNYVVMRESETPNTKYKHSAPLRIGIGAAARRAPGVVLVLEVMM